MQVASLESTLLEERRSLVFTAATLSTRVSSIARLQSEIAWLKPKSCLRQGCPQPADYNDLSDISVLRTFYPYLITLSGVATLFSSNSTNHLIASDDDAIYVVFGATIPPSDKLETVNYHGIEADRHIVQFTADHSLPKTELLNILADAQETDRMIVFAGHGDGGAVAQLTLIHTLALLSGYPQSNLAHSFSLNDKEKKLMLIARKRFLAPEHRPQAIVFGPTPTFTSSDVTFELPMGRSVPLRSVIHCFYSPRDHELSQKLVSIPAALASQRTWVGSTYYLNTPVPDALITALEDLPETLPESVKAIKHTIHVRLNCSSGMFDAVKTSCPPKLFPELHIEWDPTREVDPTHPEPASAIPLQTMEDRLSLVGRLSRAASALPFPDGPYVGATAVVIGGDATPSEVLERRVDASNVQLGARTAISGDLVGVYKLDIRFADFQEFAVSKGGHQPVASGLVPPSAILCSGIPQILYLAPLIDLWGPLGDACPVHIARPLQVRYVNRGGGKTSKTRDQGGEAVRSAAKSAAVYAAIGGAAYGPGGALVGGLIGGWKGSSKVKKRFEESRGASMVPLSPNGPEEG